MADDDPKSDLEALYDVEVELMVVLGTAMMPISQVLKLGRGAVVVGCPNQNGGNGLVNIRKVDIGREVYAVPHRYLDVVHHPDFVDRVRLFD